MEEQKKLYREEYNEEEYNERLKTVLKEENQLSVVEQN